MTVKRDVLEFRYDDVEPAFTELVGGWYYHLRTKRRFDKDEFDAKLVAEGKSFAEGELGIPSLAYILTHEYILWGAVFSGETPTDPITGTVTKVPAGVDDTGEITFADGPSDGLYSMIITTQDSTSGAAEKPTSYIFTGETVEEVAKKAGAMPHDPNLSDVAVVGAVVTFTPSVGGSITNLAIVIA